MEERASDHARGTHGAPFEPCIWMSAGLVAYKLCDLDYECDRCRFDAVMRGERRAATTPTRRSDSAPSRRALAFPADRLYDERHVWVRPVSPDRPAHYRLGIDAFAAWLVGAVTAVIAPAPGARLERGGPGCWICGALGTISVKSPVEGAIASVNSALKELPRLATEDPYGRGWLIEAEAPHAEERLGALQNAVGMRARARAQMLELNRIIASEACRGRATVGETLADGGERVSDWRDIVTRDRARGIVQRFLG